MLTIVAIITAPLLLLGGAGLVLALFVFPEPGRPLAGTVTLAVFGIALFALGVFVLVVWRNKVHTRVQLYEGGLVELVRQKRRELPWHAIATFNYTTLASGAYSVTQLTITPKDGPLWRFNSQHLLGLQTIADKVAAAVTDLTLPSMRERLARGERVRFGKITLSREGIHQKQRLLPWKEVAGAWFHLGYLRVLRHGDAASALVLNPAQLERADALLTLIRENCRRVEAHAPFAASTSFRQLLPKLVLQTMLGVPLAALFFGFAGYNLWQAFRSLTVAATNHYRGPLPSLAWALVTAALGAFVAAGYCYDLTRALRQRRLAQRLAKDGKLVPVMVLENKYEEWSFHAGWRYRYLTPRGFEGVDRVDVSLGGAATWSTNTKYLVALCSPDERESLLITMSGFPLAALPVTPHATTVARS